MVGFIHILLFYVIQTPVDTSPMTDLKGLPCLNIKSVSPKISRIGQRKRKNEFFLIWPKEPIWLPVFGNDIKRFDLLFFSSKFAKLENSATGPSAAAMRREI